MRTLWNDRIAIIAVLMYFLFIASIASVFASPAQGLKNNDVHQSSIVSENSEMVYEKMTIEVKDISNQSGNYKMPWQSNVIHVENKSTFLSQESERVKLTDYKKSFSYKRVSNVIEFIPNNKDKKSNYKAQF